MSSKSKMKPRTRKQVQNLEPKPKQRRGFSVVELVASFIVITILAALAIPAIINQFDKIRTDDAITEAAIARTAMQVISSDAYSHNGVYYKPDGSVIPNILNVSGSQGTAPMIEISTELNTLIGAVGSKKYELVSWVIDDGEVTTFVVKIPAGATVTWDGSNYLVT